MLKEFEMAAVYDRARPRSDTTLRAEELLSRYPNLKEEELAELINLFPHLNMIARGLMAADERLGAKVEAFYTEHGDRLDGGLGGRTKQIALATFAGFFLLWMILA
jgi:hypothetical protein